MALTCPPGTARGRRGRRSSRRPQGTRRRRPPRSRRHRTAARGQVRNERPQFLGSLEPLAARPSAGELSMKVVLVTHRPDDEASHSERHRTRDLQCAKAFRRVRRPADLESAHCRSLDEVHEPARRWSRRSRQRYVASLHVVPERAAPPTTCSHPDPRHVRSRAPARGKPVRAFLTTPGTRPAGRPEERGVRADDEAESAPPAEDRRGRTFMCLVGRVHWFPRSAKSVHTARAFSRH